MSEETKMLFTVVSCGRDEYPGDGLRVVADKPTNMHWSSQLDKHFLDAMGVEVQAGDEVEVTARVVSRVVTRREPL